jgi:hypothetical protein
LSQTIDYRNAYSQKLIKLKTEQDKKLSKDEFIRLENIVKQGLKMSKRMRSLSQEKEEMR